MRSTVVTLGLGLLFCACANPGDEDAGPRVDGGVVADSGARDSGTPTDNGVFDAALDGGGSDASMGDADPGMDVAPGMDVPPGMDAEPTDAIPNDGGPRIGPITIVFQEDSPYGTSGTAVFQDGTGAIQTTRTTTVGQIIETIEEGWMVTLAPAPGQLAELFTITAIAPGETYRITSRAQSPTVAQMSFGIGGAYAGAAYYGFGWGCNSGFLTTDPTAVESLDVQAECIGPTSTLDFLAVAFDQSDQRIAFRLLEDVPVVQGGTVILTAPWRTDFDLFDLDVTNPPSGSVFLIASVAIESNGGQFDIDGPFIDLAGGTGHQTFQRAPFGEGISTRYDLRGTTGGTWLQRSTSPPASSAYDLSADFLPFPGQVTLAPSPTVGRPTATWPLVPGLDFVSVQVLSPSLEVDWRVFLRGDATTFTFPELPVELANFRPIDLGEFQGAVIAIDADSILDYEASRARFGASLYDWDRQLSSEHEPPASQVRGSGQYLEFD